MEKWTVTLEQHTPLIHFQYDQEGACLRASEVKPRLDKFIINDGSFDDWKQYLIGYLHVSDKQMTVENKSEKEIKKIKTYCEKREATLRKKFESEGFRGLDYKLTILPTSKTAHYYEANDLNMYFGNQGDSNSNLKKGILYDGDIILQFTSKHEQLILFIKEKLAGFLSQTNFGCRQTKGYGSFFLKKLPNDTSDNIPQNADYSFIIPTGDLGAMIKQLSDFYSVLRAGINNNLYIKSALYKYLAEKNIQWDKKTIKQKFYTKEEKDKQKDKHPKEAIVDFKNNTGREHIYKELLGLSTNETWKKISKDMENKHSLQREHVCEDSSKKITRFKSPILFKPIKINEKSYKIYIYLSEIPQEMKGQQFKIIWDKRKEDSLTLETDKEFSIIAYFKWVFKQKNELINSLVSEGKGTDRFEEIRKCFAGLQQIKK